MDFGAGLVLHTSFDISDDVTSRFSSQKASAGKKKSTMGYSNIIHHLPGLGVILTVSPSDYYRW